MKSIIHDEQSCYVCGSTKFLQDHHIYGGSNRKHSEKYGLKVHLCVWHHTEPPTGVHHNEMLMNHLHKVGQKAFEEKYGTREDFMKIFGRNYL